MKYFESLSDDYEMGNFIVKEQNQYVNMEETYIEYYFHFYLCTFGKPSFWSKNTIFV